MKTKIVYEDFNKETGLTTVTLQNKYGHFTGTAVCSPEDDFSMFHGERIAATRANIKLAKFRLQQEKAKYKAIVDLVKDILCDDNKTFSTNDDCLLHAATKMRVYEKSIEYWKDTISILKHSIKQMDEERQRVLLRSKKNK